MEPIVGMLGAVGSIQTPAPKILKTETVRIPSISVLGFDAGS